VGLIQHASGSATSGTTVSATFGTATAGGAAIVVCVSNQSGATVSSIALSGSSDTFTQAVGITGAEIWIDASDSSGHTVVTVTFSGTISSAAIDIYEWSGIFSGTADKTHTGSNSSGVTSWSSGSTGTLTQASEVAFGVVTVNTEGGGNTTLTGPGSPWTNEPQINQSAGISQLSGYQQVSATTALTYNGTSSVLMAYDACIATFKLAAAAGVSGTTQPRATVPVPRRKPARALWQRITGQAFTAVPAPSQQPRPAPRRIPARAYVRFTPVATANKVPKTLLISLASAAGTDDYGNAFPQGIYATTGVIEGPTIISSDAFYYSPSPGAGNLIQSVLNGSGTDQYGNQYLAGLASYDNGTGSAISLSGDLITFWGGSLSGGWTEQGAIDTAAAGNPLYFYFNSVLLNSSAAQTIPFGTISSFPLASSATLAEVITAVNSLYAALQTLGII
jgi:hypothetical protein